MRGISLTDSKTVPDAFRVRSLLLFGFYAQYIDLVIVLGAGGGDVGDQGVDLHDQRALGGQIGLAVHQVFLAVNQQVGDADLRCHGVSAAVQRQAAPGGVPIIAEGLGMTVCSRSKMQSTAPQTRPFSLTLRTPRVSGSCPLTRILV